MMVDLFDYDFSEEVTDEKLEEYFYEIQLIFKGNGNGRLLLEEDIQGKIKPFLHYMMEKGWLIYSPNKTGYDVHDEHVIYHSVDELIEEYREKIYGTFKLMKEEDMNYYDHLLPVINSCSPPIRWTQNTEKRKQVEIAKKEIVKDVETQLSLQHFLEKPKSRGYQTNPMGTKWAKKNVLPIIIDNVQITEDIEEIKQFFYTRIWFMGRDDWKSNIHPPYPLYKRIMPSSFQLACLAEAVTSKEVKLILKYANAGFGYTEKTSDELEYVYPGDWSYERYMLSLTKDDLNLIRSDQ